MGPEQFTTGLCLPCSAQSAPLAALGAEAGDPDGFVPALGPGRNAVLAVRNADFAAGTSSPPLTLL